jgi:hypothetical protein
VPTFCRHNRFVENCPICSKNEVTPGLSRPASPAARRNTGTRPAASRPAAAPAKRARRPRAGEMKVRRVHRAVDDGYDHELVPGIRASEDARRLAAEIAFSVARQQALRDDPPGLYADAALAEDREEGIWLAFLIAYLGPLEGVDDPFESIRAAHRPWSTGELPNLEDVARGPLSVHDPRRGASTLTAYRAWAQRAGGQQAAMSAEPSMPPQRRFDRVFERLALPGLARAGRYEFLVIASQLGLAPIEAGSLLLNEPMDPTMLAAKRVFGMGDALILRQRSAALAREADLPIGSLDLALVNWARPDGRVTTGVPVEEDAAVRERVEQVLGVVQAAAAPPADEED